MTTAPARRRPAAHKTRSMAQLFISDLHLCSAHPQIETCFLNFLQGQARSAEALYILGDLFEAWIGDDVMDDSDFQQEYAAVIKSLSDFTRSGIPVYVMHGNRDFLLGESFARITGCQLLPDPTIIDLYGRATLLTHGDELCTDDVGYQTFRQQVRQKDWQLQFLSLSLPEREKIAQEYRAGSKQQTATKAPEIMDVNQAAVEDWMQKYQVQHIIHGHTHRPHIHHFEINGQAMTRYVMAAWHESGNALLCTEQGCELKYFS